MKKKSETTAKRKSEELSAPKIPSSKKAVRTETRRSKTESLSDEQAKTRLKKSSESESKPAKESAASARKIVVKRTSTKSSESARAKAGESSEKKVKTAKPKKSIAISEVELTEKAPATPRERVSIKSVAESPAEKPKKVIRVVKARKTPEEKVIAVPKEEIASPKRKRKQLEKSGATFETAPKIKVVRRVKTAEVKKTRSKRVTVKKLLEEISAKAPTRKRETSAAPEAERSPIFRELAEPKLPDLPSEDRARLQLQSPNRVFFYWSLRGNPFETLKKIFGARSERFFLAAKLIDLNSGAEILLPAESQGSYWFDVSSDTGYRAEIGFQSDGGSFIRLIYSNSLRTPRTSPSPFRDFSEKFHITTEKFAQVLDFSGFSQDALSVAREEIGTKRERIKERIRAVIFGGGIQQLSREEEEELHFAIMSLASGAPLSDLQIRISQRTFELVKSVFEKRAKSLESPGLRNLFSEELEIEQEFSPAVFGASLLNFPKWKRRREKLFPVSSLRSITKR